MQRLQTTPEGYRRAVVAFGAACLQFFEMAGEVPRPHPHWAEHIALQVPEVSRLVADLQAQGVTVTRPLQTSPGGRMMAFVLDPDGRQVELLEA
ncbi:VOC family protein [Deinococcus lacus]|uniref:VOC family protein n=1 Tax=Deinococcus lacus TaxID=392561 RepID=A0ABW1Y8Y1_9DEIO